MHWNMKAVMADKGGVAVKLRGAYASPALVPGSPWLGGPKLPAPKVRSRSSGSGKTLVEWAGDAEVRFWVVQWKPVGSNWRAVLVPGVRRSFSLEDPVDAVSVSAYGRTGRLSAPGGLVRP